MSRRGERPGLVQQTSAMGLKQVPFRLHENDHKELKSKLAMEGLKIQTLVEACCLAYLDGDKHVMALALEFKNLNTVDRGKTSWSRREQDGLLDDIETIADGGTDE